MNELPATITGPAAWYGPDLAPGTDWIEILSAKELTEIELAARRFVDREPDWQTLQKDEFPLPSFALRLGRMLEEVLNGRGFVLIRGVPVEQWGRRLSATAFLGVGLHLGKFCSQNKHGHLLGHVKDLGLSSEDPNVRIYQTRERQNYHTDSCDICRSTLLAAREIRRALQPGQLRHNLQRNA